VSPAGPPVAPRPVDEAQRLAALDMLGLLSPYPEEGMLRAARLAARVMDTPAAGFSLVGEAEQWFKAGNGLPYERAPRDGAFCAWAIVERQALVVPDATRDLRFRDSPIVAGEPGVRFYAGVAVRDLAGHAVGTLCALDVRPRRPSAGQIRALDDIAVLLERELWLKALAVFDPLTGLYNRRFFADYAGREWRRARRDAAPVSVLMLDLDHFGEYNRACGHEAGDRALQAVARVLRGALQRGGDLVARYGGEEFVAVLPRTDAAGASAVAERVRAQIEALGIVHAPGSGAVVTASIGVATLAHGERDPLEVLLRRADAALFRAKEDGRNRVAAPHSAALFRSE
jgi:diguanylate cyclase (GGDEF)-like protein